MLINEIEDHYKTTEMISNISLWIRLWQTGHLPLFAYGDQMTNHCLSLQTAIEVIIASRLSNILKEMLQSSQNFL